MSYLGYEIRIEEPEPNALQEENERLKEEIAMLKKKLDRLHMEQRSDSVVLRNPQLELVKEVLAEFIHAARAGNGYDSQALISKLNGTNDR